jgi:hypothetical protein
MYEKIIRRGLPATVTQLYEMAKKHQPQDWGCPPCPHREKLNVDDLECMHQLRRELFKLALHTGGRNGIWYLKTK